MAKIPKTAKKSGFGDPWETPRGGFYINPSRRGPAVPAGSGVPRGLRRHEAWSLSRAAPALEG